MKLRNYFLLILALVCCADTARAEQPKMNVVFFLIDDLGWRDLGCNGSDYYKTPNIDRLAKEGVRFTDAYAACTVCSPTRAAIMTGKYPARLLLTQWLPSGRWSRTGHKMKEGRYISNLPLEEVTIAEALRQHGYKTAFMGKWHLGTETYYYPEHQGFDVNIAGRDYGAPGSYFFPFTGKWRIPSTGKTLHKKQPLSGKKGDYLADRLAEEAEGFIRSNAEYPFFLMLSHYAVHTPLQGKPDKVAKYEAVVWNSCFFRTGLNPYRSNPPSPGDKQKFFCRSLFSHFETKCENGQARLLLFTMKRRFLLHYQARSF